MSLDRVTFRELFLYQADDVALLRNMKLRDEDEEEVKALLGDVDVAEALITSVKVSSVTYAVFYDNELCFVFGLVDSPTDSTKTSPWMLGTNESLKHVRPLLRFSKMIISAMLEGYSTLENVVWEGNTKHIVWLKKTGFTFDNDRDIIINDSKFLYFYMERH